MANPIATAFALTAAALFVGCGKQPAETTPPGGDDAAPAAADGVAADSAAEDPVDAGPEVKCLGINECSGQSACDVAGSHECGGQNDCKGKGWILVSQSECETKGGTVL